MAMNDLQELFRNVGIKTDEERAVEEQSRQIQQLQLQLQQQQGSVAAGNMSTGFGGPAYIAAQLKAGNPGATPIRIPSLSNGTQMSTQGVPWGSGRTPGIIPGATSNPSPVAPGTGQEMAMSDQVAQMAQQYAAQGKQPEAARLRMKAMQLRIEEEQAAAEMAQKEQASQLALVQAQKPEGMGTVGVEGDPFGRQEQYRQLRPDLTGYDIKNQGPAYKVGEGGVKVTVDNGNILSANEQGKVVTEFGNQYENSLNFLQSAMPVYKLLGQGATSGFTAKIVGTVDNLLSTAKTTMSSLVDPQEGSNVTKMLDDSFSNTGWWKTMAGKTQLSQAGFTGLAYTLAASYNKDGRISDKDMAAALKELGSDLSDPDSARRILKEAISRTRKRLEVGYRKSKQLAPGARQIEGLYADANKEFKDFLDTEAAPTIKPTYDDPAKQKAFEEYLKAHPELQ